MRVLDLFSGIGGFSLGLKHAGMETVAFCEIDPYCREVLKRHWPDVPCHDDVTTREFIEGEADVITAGFPCQDISLAGQGAGLAGERSGLYREVVRAIRMVRPAFALLENVAALLGRGMGTVLGDLAALGYDTEWHCIPASAVGAPHRRDRVWIVAYPGSEQHKAGCASLGRPESKGFQQKNMANTNKPGLEEWESLERGGSKEQPPTKRNGCCSQHRTEEWLSEPDLGRVAHGIPAGLHEEIEAWPHEYEGHGIWAMEPKTPRVKTGVKERVNRLRALGNAVVPQIPEILGRVIMERMRNGQGKS